MDGLFSDAVTVSTGPPSVSPGATLSFDERGRQLTDRFYRQPAGVTSVWVPPTWQESDGPRGLALKYLRADRSFEGFVGRWLHTHQELYFVSVAFDMSPNDPVVLPPTTSKLDSVYRSRVGEKVEFTWGSGAPLFPARIIHGSLLLYVTLMEKAAGPKIGAILAKVHEDLKADGTLLDRIRGLLESPGEELARDLLAAGAAALEPIATILKESGDNYIGVFQGGFGAHDDWHGHLKQRQNGATVSLVEL